MVDGNEERRDRPGGPEADRGRGELDRTRAFDRAEPEPGAAREPGRAGNDETARQAGPDQTAPYRPVGGPGSSPGATAPMPRGPSGARPDQPAAWSGRAAVPTATGAEVRESGPVGWAAAEERPDGRPWWLPIVAGIVALVLLAVLAYGLWLIVQSRDGEAPVEPTRPPVTASAAPSRTSAPPRTEPPSPTGRETTAGTVLMPPVEGLRQEEATALLDQLGLNYRLRFRQSDRPAGTVISSDPEVGRPVSPGTRITLVVAEAQRQDQTTAPPPATATTQPPD